MPPRPAARLQLLPGTSSSEKSSGRGRSSHRENRHEEIREKPKLRRYPRQHFDDDEDRDKDRDDDEERRSSRRKPKHPPAILRDRPEEAEPPKLYDGLYGTADHKHHGHHGGQHKKPLAEPAEEPEEEEETLDGQSAADDNADDEDDAGGAVTVGEVVAAARASASKSEAAGMRGGGSDYGVVHDVLFHHLCARVRPSIMSRMRKIWERSNADISLFRKNLARVPAWNDHVVKIAARDATSLDKYTTSYFEFAFGARCLLLSNAAKRDTDMDLEIPTPRFSEFIHRVYIEYASFLAQYPRLMKHTSDADMDDLERARVERHLAKQCDECISTALQLTVPFGKIIGGTEQRTMAEFQDEVDGLGESDDDDGFYVDDAGISAEAAAAGAPDNEEAPQPSKADQLTRDGRAPESFAATADTDGEEDDGEDDDDDDEEEPPSRGSYGRRAPGSRRQQQSSMRGRRVRYEETDEESEEDDEEEDEDEDSDEDSEEDDSEEYSEEDSYDSDYEQRRAVSRGRFQRR